MKDKKLIAEQDAKFLALAEYVGGKEGKALSEAFRDLYSLFDDTIIDWFAGLYDANYGGYYYSNSARDNKTVVVEEGEFLLLPDTESTCQALGFWESSGMSNDVGGLYENAIPKWMADQIAERIYSLQDPDGYFYNPQWGKNIIISRRARDFNWCTRILSKLGRPLKYPTILDKKDGTASEQTLVPEHLSSREKFIEYLEAGDIATKSYPLGNQLSCQSSQIKALGLMDTCIDFLNAHQHADTGHWHHESSYTAINGVMKISGVYNAAGRVMPNAMNTALSVIDAINSDEPVVNIVSLWNTWEAVVRIIGTLRKFGDANDIRHADEIVAKLRQCATSAVIKSRDKLVGFKRDDGAFSYRRDGIATHRSQGAPVAIKDTVESDVNGNVIATSLMVNSIYSALGLFDFRPRMFGEADRLRYIELLEAKR